MKALKTHINPKDWNISSKLFSVGLLLIFILTSIQSFGKSIDSTQGNQQLRQSDTLYIINGATFKNIDSLQTVVTVSVIQNKLNNVDQPIAIEKLPTKESKNTSLKKRVITKNLPKIKSDININIDSDQKLVLLKSANNIVCSISSNQNKVGVLATSYTIAKKNADFSIKAETFKFIQVLGQNKVKHSVRPPPFNT